MNIHATVIPNDQHRTGISGADWQFDSSGDLHVRISHMSDKRYEMALMIHEIVEAVLCKHAGITDQTVDSFDMDYERIHPERHGIEAGDSEFCPYLKQHSQATAAERIVASELGIVWSKYDAELETL